VSGHDSPDRRGRRGAAIVVVVCALTVGVTALVGFAPAIGERWGWSEPSRPAYALGDSVDVPRRLYDESAQTLLVFASGTCGACLRSAAAFGELAVELRGTQTRFLLLTPTIRHADQESLLAAASLQASEFAAFDLTTLRLKSVPSVVLVDRAGRILYSREGYVDEDARAAIRAAIKGHQLQG
jgi:hypothetical protein